MPEPGDGEVRIKNHATAINRADLMQRGGMYPPPPGASTIIGLECAGEIEAVGPNVSRWQVGDKVCALLAGGGYAEYTTCPQEQVLPVPDGLSFEEAAALPEVFATAYLNLFMEASLQPGERVLLHAGASGVGTAGIQLCKAFGNPCFVTVGGDDKIEECKALGASGGSNRHSGGFAEHVQDWTEGNGFDVILDPVGAGYLEDNLKSLAMEGRLVLIGLMSGHQTDISLALMMMKRLRIIGSTLRARSKEAKGEVMRRMEEQVWPRLVDGRIKPIIHTIMPIQEANAAYDVVASNETIGKVVLKI